MVLASIRALLSRLAGAASKHHDGGGSECIHEGVSPHVANVDRFYVVGHRGAAAHEVENTLPSMARAIADGANAVELDLSLTKDGHVVLWHDWDPDGAIATFRELGAEGGVLARPRPPSRKSPYRRPIDALTLDEMRAHFGYTVHGEAARVAIPTFEQFLDWAETAPGLEYVVLDIKIPDEKAALTETMIETVLRSVRRRRPAYQYFFTVAVGSVWERMSRMLLAQDILSFDADPGLVVIDDADRHECSSRKAMARGGGYATTVLPKGWSPQAWKSLQKLVACDLDARDSGGLKIPTKVFAATIDDVERMECLLDMGVDGILIDQPVLLRSVVEARRRRARAA